MSTPFPPITTGATAAASNSRSIGDILVATGRLSAPNLQRILAAQEKDKLAFGDAALALKLLTKADIDFALSKQFNYAYLQEGGTTLGSDLVAAYKPFSPVGENLRAVRSQLMLRWFDAEALLSAMRDRLFCHSTSVVSPSFLTSWMWCASSLNTINSGRAARNSSTLPRA